VRINDLSNYIIQKYSGRQISYKIKIIGLILILFGIMCFWIPYEFGYNFAVIFFLWGIGLIFFISEQSNQIETDFAFMSIIIFFIVFLYLFLFAINSDIFFILILLGVLLIKEFSDEYFTSHFRKRVSVLIVVLFFISIFIVVEKIINILHI
jgi:hypothetical protein